MREKRCPCSGVRADDGVEGEEQHEVEVAGQPGGQDGQPGGVMILKIMDHHHQDGQDDPP